METPVRPVMNRGKAIHEMCIECMGYQVRQVKECPDPACPLWEWRLGGGAPERTSEPIHRQQV